MDIQPTSPSHAPRQDARRRFPRIPLVLVALCIGVILFVQLGEIEGNFRGPLTLLAILLTLIGFALWTLIFSGFPWRRRLKIVGGGFLGLVGVVVILTLLTRREGSYTGAGVPRLVWRWSSKPIAPPLEVMVRPADGAIDLTKTTPEDFPRFLGPDGDSQVRGAKLSREWSAHPPKLLWRRKPIGTGWSSFVIVGKHAITIEQRSEFETTACYNLDTGVAEWEHRNKAYLHEPEGGDGPRGTPTIHNGHVYSLGGLGNFDCLNGANGDVIWSRSLFADPGKQRLHYGQTCSPLIVDNMVIVTGGKTGPTLLAFDKETGKPLWQSPDDQPAYASPSLATLAGVRQILCVHQASIAGHDLNDGHILWQFPWSGFMPKNSQAMAAGNDRVYCSTGYSIGSLLLQVKSTGSKFSVSEIWHSTAMKTEMSNVILRDGYVYGLDDGTLLCQELATGKRVWRKGRYGHGQILQAGDLMIVQAEEGFVALVDANPAGGAELGRIEVFDSKTWNNPALAGHHLLLRNDREAACYLLP